MGSEGADKAWRVRHILSKKGKKAAESFAKDMQEKST